MTAWKSTCREENELDRLKVIHHWKPHELFCSCQHLVVMQWRAEKLLLVRSGVCEKVEKSSYLPALGFPDMAAPCTVKKKTHS